MNFLLPDREFGEGWGGVKNLRLLQRLLYTQELRTHTTYTVPKKSDRVFSPTSAIVRTMKNLTNQKITRTPIKQLLNLSGDI